MRITNQTHVELLSLAMVGKAITNQDLDVYKKPVWHWSWAKLDLIIM